MARKSEAVWQQPWFLVEAFALVNLGFLTFDIYLAHSVNGFRRSAEYIPLYFLGGGSADPAGRPGVAIPLDRGLEGSRVSGGLGVAFSSG